MLGTTLAEGRTLGPSGSYLQRCCDKNNSSNFVWPPLSSSLPPIPYPIPPAHLSSFAPLPPPPPPPLEAHSHAPHLAHDIHRQPKPAHLNRNNNISSNISISNNINSNNNNDYSSSHNSIWNRSSSNHHYSNNINSSNNENNCNNCNNSKSSSSNSSSNSSSHNKNSHSSSSGINSSSVTTSITTPITGTTTSNTTTATTTSTTVAANNNSTLKFLHNGTTAATTNTEVTESLFAAGGYNTPPVSSPFLPVPPFELVTKNFHHGGSLAYSQANSIFVQSQTDYLNGITSSVSKKTETCYGRWEHATLEPLHIQVPPLQPVTNVTIKSESISCGSARSSKFEELTPHPPQLQTPQHSGQGYHHNHHHQQQQQLSGGNNNSLCSGSNSNNNLHQYQIHSNAGGNNTGGLVTTMTTSSPSTTCMPSSNDLSNGCSRTIPISWSTSGSSTSSSSSSVNSNIPSSTSHLLGAGRSSSSCTSSPYPDSQHQTHSQTLSQTQTTGQQHHAASSSSAISSSSSCTLLQIKREPCQVSEVTTSNNLGHQQSHRTSSTSALTAVIKIESSSPKSTAMDNHTISAAQNSAGAIPVGIAVARQRLQEHATMAAHQPKEMNRFGIGIADIGGGASSLSQNMFFTGTNSTMIPLTSDALTMGVSNVHNAVRTPPTLWQYPTPVPVESMLPVPIPPAMPGLHLVRDPGTGQFIFLPAAALEPFQQAVVWPTYSQPTASLQPPHLLLPPMAQSIQPPSLAPLQLLGSDYLTTASTTLHQHTQTHSTRLVALTSDTKRKPTIPLPIPHHVIKIEDCSSGSTTTTGAGTTTAHHHHHHQSAIYGEEKGNGSLHTTAATITTAVQTNDLGSNLPTHLYYHPSSAGLIQIAPHHPQSANGMTNNLGECRSLENETPPTLGLAPIHAMNSPPQISQCLTPPPEHVPDNLEASTSCVPEVQDATIQTDTPVMSEDDNTNGADECMSPINNTSCNNGLDEARDMVVPSSTSLADLCHNVSSNTAEDTSPQDCSLKQIQDVDSSRNDSGFDSNAVTSTNSLEEHSNIRERWMDNNINNQIGEERHYQHIQNNDHGRSSFGIDMSIRENGLKMDQMAKATSTPVDLSGLELLSNISIEAIEKKVDFIKQEPCENRKCSYEPAASSPITAIPNAEEKLDNSEKFSGQDEQLGGLNLLCALAEQRIQEEVGQRCRKRSSSSSDSHESKKKKHKHSSSKKSSKKSRHDKDKKEKKRQRHSTETDSHESPDKCERNDDLGKDIKDTLIRVKAKYTRCSSCKSENGSSRCCREKCNWPTTEELINAMETDMRLRLADITRQCQEKKRELAEISPMLQQRKHLINNDRETTSLIQPGRPLILEKPPSQPLKPASIAPLSPNMSSQSQLVIEIPKISSDTESSKFEDVETSSSSSSKRKAGNPKKHDDGNTETIVAKKPKSLVGYILASKNRINDNVKDKNVFDSPTGFFTDDASVFSESSCKLRASAFKLETVIKQEIVEDENAKPITDGFSPFSDSSSFTPEKKFHKKSSKHHSKHKKSKSSKERKHKSADIKDRKKKIDSRCLLRSEHLDKDKTRVLTAMGGLFYAGCLSPVEPPDVYSVTLDGERGNRPHIMSREEVLRDAILEVSPASVDEILPGTRLCAYWSQQYRCLYPGTAAEPGTPDSINDKKFVSVEFDDGDSGKIALEDIRFLLSDYPIVEYDPNPLLTLGKRKRRISHTTADVQIPNGNVNASQSQSTKSTAQVIALTGGTNCFKIGLEQDCKTKQEIDKESYKERRRLKKIRKDRLKRLDLDGRDNFSGERKHKHKHKNGDELCKHRKHKKRRKHKKHHHNRDPSLPVAGESSQDGDYSQDASQIGDVSIENGESASQNGDVISNVDQALNEATLATAAMTTSDFDPNLKEDTMTEEEVESSITESSGSVYEPGKKKERQNSGDNHSKIAAFLPARQLWAWSGKGYRRAGAKGRAKKQFYKTIQRGKETITIGDSAVFLSTGRPDRPYIGRIESMWETTSSNKIVRVKWFYHPEETEGCPNLKIPGALFESPHEDENDVQTISHKCEVMPLADYTNKFGMDPKQYQSIYDNNDTYYLAGYYDPTVRNLKLKQQIPTLAPNDKWV